MARCTRGSIWGMPPHDGRGSPEGWNRLSSATVCTRTSAQEGPANASCGKCSIVAGPAQGPDGSSFRQLSQGHMRADPGGLGLVEPDAAQPRWIRRPSPANNGKVCVVEPVGCREARSRWGDNRSGCRHLPGFVRSHDDHQVGEPDSCGGRVTYPPFRTAIIRHGRSGGHHSPTLELDGSHRGVRPDHRLRRGDGVLAGEGDHGLRRGVRTRWRKAVVPCRARHRWLHERPRRVQASVEWTRSVQRLRSVSVWAAGLSSPRR